MSPWSLITSDLKVLYKTPSCSLHHQSRLHVFLVFCTAGRYEGQDQLRRFYCHLRRLVYSYSLHNLIWFHSHAPVPFSVITASPSVRIRMVLSVECQRHLSARLLMVGGHYVYCVYCVLGHRPPPMLCPHTPGESLRAYFSRPFPRHGRRDHWVDSRHRALGNP